MCSIIATFETYFVGTDPVQITALDHPDRIHIIQYCMILMLFWNIPVCGVLKFAYITLTLVYREGGGSPHYMYGFFSVPNKQKQNKTKQNAKETDPRH